jgi:hypothetical protein
MGVGVWYVRVQRTSHHHHKGSAPAGYRVDVSLFSLNSSRAPSSQLSSHSHVAPINMILTLAWSASHLILRENHSLLRG